MAPARGAAAPPSAARRCTNPAHTPCPPRARAPAGAAAARHRHQRGRKVLHAPGGGGGCQGARGLGPAGCSSQRRAPASCRHINARGAPCPALPPRPSPAPARRSCCCARCGAASIRRCRWRSSGTATPRWTPTAWRRSRPSLTRWRDVSGPGVGALRWPGLLGLGTTGRGNLTTGFGLLEAECGPGLQQPVPARPAARPRPDSPPPPPSRRHQAALPRPPPAGRQAGGLPHEAIRPAAQPVRRAPGPGRAPPAPLNPPRTAAPASILCQPAPHPPPPAPPHRTLPPPAPSASSGRSWPDCTPPPPPPHPPQLHAGAAPGLRRPAAARPRVPLRIPRVQTLRQPLLERHIQRRHGQGRGLRLRRCGGGWARGVGWVGLGLGLGWVGWGGVGLCRVGLGDYVGAAGAAAGLGGCGNCVGARVYLPRAGGGTRRWGRSYDAGRCLSRPRRPPTPPPAFLPAARAPPPQASTAPRSARSTAGRATSCATPRAGRSWWTARATWVRL
jgi:hypothetical protein